MKHADRLVERLYILFMAATHIVLSAFGGLELAARVEGVSLTAFEWAVIIGLALIWGRLEASAPLNPLGIREE